MAAEVLSSHRSVDDSKGIEIITWGGVLHRDKSVTPVRIVRRVGRNRISNKVLINWHSFLGRVHRILVVTTMVSTASLSIYDVAWADILPLKIRHCSSEPVNGRQYRSINKINTALLKMWRTIVKKGAVGHVFIPCSFFFVFDYPRDNCSRFLRGLRASVLLLFFF